MDWRTFEIAEWLPDLPELGNPGATVAKNCIPAANSYKPFPDAEVYSTATGSLRIRGGIAVQDNAGATYVYAGDANKIYDLSATTWDDVSVAANYSASGTTEVWNFAQWGNQIVATNYKNAPQVITLGGANFAALGGSPPKARYIAVVRDFLVLANVNDGTERPNRVIWSGFNDITTWTASQLTQSDSQDIQDGGWINGLIGGEYGTIVQERAINRMTYVGPPLIFQFDQVEQNKGTTIPGSVVSHSGAVAYWGEDDIMLFNGQLSQSISSNKVTNTVYDDVDAGFLDRICSVVNPSESIFCWLYPGSGNSNGTPNRMLIYNWAVNRWSLCEIEAEYLMRVLSPGYSLEGLDAVSTSLDALPASLDDRLWYGGGAPRFGGFNSSHQLITFTGTPLDATVETMEERFTGQNTTVTNLRPLVEGGSYTAQVGMRSSQSGSIRWSPEMAPNTWGECNVRINGRFARVRVKATGNWEHIHGVDIKARGGGWR